ncbi:hypothetical protein [Bacillus altitudinis]|uniref:hypothetical protein n=1 Tax=Bacillus altitudinis TaxID=293387 RepID=UPI00227F018E|nr:hypothetical protein [Bacillus altitudinis]MCY7454248.1 hypothetical protein [Bacillus altitudinis]
MRKVLLGGVMISLLAVAVACNKEDESSKQTDTAAESKQAITKEDTQQQEKQTKNIEKEAKGEVKDNSDNSKGTKENGSEKNDSTDSKEGKIENSIQKSDTQEQAKKNRSNVENSTKENKATTHKKVTNKNNNHKQHVKRSNEQKVDRPKKRVSNHKKRDVAVKQPQQRKEPKKSVTKQPVTNPNHVTPPSHSGNFSAMKARFAKYGYTTGTKYNGFSKFSSLTSQLAAGGSVSGFKNSALDYSWKENGKEYAAWSADAIKFTTSSLDVEEVLAQVNSNGGNFGGMITDIQFYYNASSKTTTVALTGVQLKYN